MIITGVTASSQQSATASTVEYIGVTANRSGATFDLSYPTGYATGDMLVVIMVTYGQFTSDVSGMTNIAVVDRDCGISGEASAQAAYRIIESGDTASITIPDNGPFNTLAALYCIRGPSATDFTYGTFSACAAGSNQYTWAYNAAITPTGSGAAEAFIMSGQMGEGQSSMQNWSKWNPTGTTLDKNFGTPTTGKYIGNIYHYDDLKDNTAIAASSVFRPKTDATSASITVAVYPNGTI